MEGPTTREHKKDARKASCAIVTLSDTRTLEDDESGNIIQELVEKDRHSVVERMVVKDDPVLFKTLLLDLVGKEVDAVLVNGGTGLSGSDISVEVAEKLFDKRISAFGPLFSMLSLADIGTAAMLSRATAGVVKRTAIFCMPGSPKACELAVSRLILPELSHVIHHVQEG